MMDRTKPPPGWTWDLFPRLSYPCKANEMVRHYNSERRVHLAEAWHEYDELARPAVEDARVDERIKVLRDLAAELEDPTSDLFEEVREGSEHDLAEMIRQRAAALEGKAGT